jgi:hypothetical protein
VLDTKRYSAIQAQAKPYKKKTCDTPGKPKDYVSFIQVQETSAKGKTTSAPNAAITLLAIVVGV